jgi:G6PDH family F420-dependent oxidoreductase
MHFGYTLMAEQSGPRDLVNYAVAAERAGFDFEVCSDHYSPWLLSQGHSPYAWSVLGAVAQATSQVELATYVTCPIIRYHPAVVAQKAATLQLLSEGRFILGLGSGENLNEHITGEGWPPVAQRQDMLVEAATIIRELHMGSWSSGRAITSASIRVGCGTHRRMAYQSPLQCQVRSRLLSSRRWLITSWLWNQKKS